MYSNSSCSCSFKREIIKFGQSSHKMYSNNILNFQESMTILNACTKKYGNLLNTPRTIPQSSPLTITPLTVCFIVHFHSFETLNLNTLNTFCAVYVLSLPPIRQDLTQVHDTRSFYSGVGVQGGRGRRRA